MPRPTHPYIRLKAEFVYLAVILDGFSRKVVGWALDRTLAIRLTIGALQQAIASRHPEAGLVHHSDRGLQYASEEYAKVLENNRVIPSMSRPANPYDNASCESFMKTLKLEEIYANNYNDLEHLRANIEEFIEQYYNRLRLHSAVGYRPPEEFASNRSRRHVRPNREAQRWRFLRTKRTAGRFRKDYWGKGLKCRPLPQTPSPARRCKNPSMKAETVSK